MKSFLFFIFFFPLFPHAQDLGISFENKLTWKQILVKAKSEHKFIFVDCYASWCGPCKKMEQTVYPNPAVGYIFNLGFISVKMQMDTAANDNSDIKKRYADAHEINDLYKIFAYPSFLFFSPEGDLVHKAVGFYPPTDFIQVAQNATNPDFQYYTLQDEYKKNKISPMHLRTLAEEAKSNGDNYLMENAASAYTDYLFNGNPDSLFTKENLGFLADFTQKSTGKSFAFFRDKAPKVDLVMKKKNYSREITDRVVIIEEIEPRLQDSTDWNLIEVAITQKYDSVTADRTVTQAKIYLSYNKDWPVFIQSLIRYTDLYEDPDDLELLNKNANFILQFAQDKPSLTKALTWSQHTLDKDASNPDYKKTHTAIRTRLEKL
jgi:thioredoxin-related protein